MSSPMPAWAELGATVACITQTPGHSFARANRVKIVKIVKVTATTIVVADKDRAESRFTWRHGTFRRSSSDYGPSYELVPADGPEATAIFLRQRKETMLDQLQTHLDALRSAIRCDDKALVEEHTGEIQYKARILRNVTCPDPQLMTETTNA